MAKIQATEREIAARSAQWLDSFCQKNHLAFTEVSVEAQARSQSPTGESTLRYGDVILWRDRRRNRAAVLLELKSPQAKADSQATLLERANAFGVPYVVAWNFQHLEIYAIQAGKLRSILRQNSAVLHKLNDWTNPATRRAIHNALETLCRELDRLVNYQPFQKFKPDRHYFVEYVRQSVQHLAHIVEQELHQAQKQEADLSELTSAYLLETHSGLREDMNEILSLQIVYRLLVKLMFYQAMQQHIPGLDPIPLDSAQAIGPKIRQAFQAAAQYGPAIVFADDPFDRHELSAESEAELVTFIRALKLYDFENMAEDVVGRLFEKIIEPDLRHRQGQFYTPEDLVDLTIALTVNDYVGPFLDPTCGSGIFLLRLYNLLQVRRADSLDHAGRLARLWGVEIGRFPASLAALNLTRQDLSNFREIARIVHADIFDVELVDEQEGAAAQASVAAKRLPRIRHILGNMPFVRHELIERSGGNYKHKLLRRLAQALLFTDSYLFVLSGDAADHLDYVAGLDQGRRRRWIDGLLEARKLRFAIPGTADIFVYVLLRLGTLLEADGRLGIISSNSWLDTKYGYLVQRYILQNFHLETITASWVEPWFEDASINTVVLVLQRRPHGVEPHEISNFVNLKQPLKELLPTRDLNTFAGKRWNDAFNIRHTVEQLAKQSQTRILQSQIPQNKDPKTTNSSANSHNLKPPAVTAAPYATAASSNKRMRVRSVPRALLENDLLDPQKPARWSRYLRAPEIYFELLEACGEKLTALKNKAEIRPGIKSGINDFFYLRHIDGFNAAAADDPVLLEASDGVRYSIEKRFLQPIIKSPRELLTVDAGAEFDFTFCAFICKTNKKTLLSQGYIGAAEYLEKAESRSNKSGVKWSEVSSVQGRKHWWMLTPPPQSDLLLPMSNNKRFAVFLAPQDILIDHNLFECTLRDPAYRTTAAAYCNSIVFSLFREVNSRVNLGDGASKTELVDWKYMPVPRDIINIPAGLTDFFKRKVKPIDQELRAKDRQALDECILESLGLDPVIYLDAVKAGMAQMVADRTRPATQRSSRKRAVKTLALSDIRRQVIKAVFPRGIRRFPDDFLPQNSLKGDQLCLPHGELCIDSMLGRHTIVDAQGQEIYSTFSVAQALYILNCAQGPLGTITVPFDELLSEKMLQDFSTYYQEQKERVFAEAMQRLHDKNAAGRMSKAILQEVNLKPAPSWKPPY